jgi:hypothetical protein
MNKAFLLTAKTPRERRKANPAMPLVPRLASAPIAGIPRFFLGVLGVLAVNK